MSKIARLPIILPQSVSLSIVDGNNQIKISSGNNAVLYPFNPIVEMVKDGQNVSFKLKVESRDRTSRSIVGTLHASVTRAITDIQNRFVAKIQLKGVGYKAVFANGILTLSLGFSHLVKIAIPTDLDVKVQQNANIEVSGFDRRVVMALAITIRNLRKPEPYKGKGVFVNDEKITIKEGKKK
jgi:large subunit ribosomal protein L6